MNIPEPVRNGQSSAANTPTSSNGKPGSHTLDEILMQPVAWQAALDVVRTRQSALHRLWQEGRFSDVLVTGCGSTYNLSLLVAPLVQCELGVRARALPASELLLFPETLLPPDGRPLLVTISRSGRTTETIRATQNYKTSGRGPILNIGCYNETELVAQSDLALVIQEGQEQSVVQTRSFSAMTIAAQASVAALADERRFEAMQALPAIGEQLISSYHDLARHLGQSSRFDRFYFLGSGLQYGLACEANLKMKEMSLSISEAFHFMEFRHGPMSIVNERTLVVGLLSETARAYELAVLEEMRALGAQTLALTEQPVAEREADYQVCFHAGLPETGRAALYLPVLQLLGFYRAISNGQDPDQPHNLTAVVVLEAGS